MTVVKKNSDKALAEAVSEYYADPLGFVLFAFPWGEAGTPLESYSGPRKWQWEFLEELGRQIKERGFDGANAVMPILMAVASGHGIGKSALTSWIILFIMATRPNCKGTATANTAAQLRTKTWAELGKWHSMCVCQHWFDYRCSNGGMSISQNEDSKGWRIEAQTCREENSEAFAGQHAANSTSLYLFDEASAVPDKIWEVAEGGLTDGEPIWIVFGNPTKNNGRFHACFNRDKHRWTTWQIDSRDVAGTNKKLLNEWAELYGEDSDFVRVRVRGVFPRAGSAQFIPNDIVSVAMKRSLRSDIWDFAPKCLGVDVARFGDDQSVLTRRQGRKVWPQKAYRGLDLMTFAGIVASEIDSFKPNAVFVDGVGVGAGLVDRLRQLGYKIIDVQSGGKALDRKNGNKRAEMWNNMKKWLTDDSPELPESIELESALTAPEYGFNQSGALMLERKQDMKKRGLASPDEADSLALTFAEPIAPARYNFDTADTDYDPLEW